MATGSLPRGLAVLQCLVGVSEGVPLSRIAKIVDLPKSATHRILVTLIEEGFVRKIEPSGNYALTLRVVSLGLRHLAFSPSLGWRFPFWRDSLTSQSNWSVWGLVDGERLFWVARTQGARGGLRYNQMSTTVRDSVGVVGQRPGVALTDER